MANVKVIVTIDGKEHFASVDMDSDLISKEPISDTLSTRVKVDEGTDFYVTDIFDLLTNCKTFKIDKL